MHETTFSKSCCLVEHRNCGQRKTVTYYNEQLNVAYTESVIGKKAENT